MTPNPDEAPQPKPQFALFLATAGGLGYLPKAPGTWGSLLGVFLGWFALTFNGFRGTAPFASGTIENGGAVNGTVNWLTFAGRECAIALVVSLIGVWAAGRVAAHLRSTDPQIVVIDEVAGQLIAYLGLATPRTFGVNWKYLLLGFILFRVFDIWKPFPARQAEFLPGGLGIMADDWIAGAYAALGLLAARYTGL